MPTVIGVSLSDLLVYGAVPEPLRFPTASTVGITDPGWTPAVTHGDGLSIYSNGTVLEDALIDGNLDIYANNVTIRRCRVVSGHILNYGANCLITDTDLIYDGPGAISDSDVALYGSNFTARRVKIVGFGEGIRLSSSDGEAGPTEITRCYVEIHEPSNPAGWHGDGLQTYGNDEPCTITDSTIIVVPTTAESNAAVFYTDDGAVAGAPLTINGLVCSGAGFTVRLNAETTGPVQDLYIVDGQWFYGPLLTHDTSPSPDPFDCHLCTLDVNGQPVAGAALDWDDG